MSEENMTGDQPVVGMRVVRGPDWMWEQQDKGEGYVGTVTDFDAETKRVKVLWDHGTKETYRAGAEGAHDLLVLDSSPAGIIHPNVVCDGCSSDCIRGARWKCQMCVNANLCTACYMGDKHDVTHLFIRFDTPGSPGCLMRWRIYDSSTRIQSRGLYTGAIVAREKEEQGQEQDEVKEEDCGVITEISTEFADKVACNWAKVQWRNGNESTHCFGHVGKNKVVAVKPGNGMLYYRDHPSPCGAVEAQTFFRAVDLGDDVNIFFDPTLMQQMQKGHGEWEKSMESLIGKTGKVAGFASNNDVLVKYSSESPATVEQGGDHLFQFNPATVRELSKLPQYQPPESPQDDKPNKVKKSSFKLAAQKLNKFFMSRQSEGNMSRTPSKEERQKKIMISYSWQLETIPRQLASRLGKMGYDVWIDTEKMHGNLYEKAGNAVNDADVVLICASDAYSKSEHCKREAKMAAEMQKRLIPIQLETEWNPDPWLAHIVAGSIRYDFSEVDFDEMLKKVVNDIEKN